MTAHISIAQLDLLKKQVRILRSMDHSEHPISVCDQACEVAEAIETLISAYEGQAVQNDALRKQMGDVEVLRLSLEELMRVSPVTVDSTKADAVKYITAMNRIIRKIHALIALPTPTLIALKEPTT